MSAPMVLNAEQLRDLSHALDGLTKIRHTTGVSLTPYGPVNMQIGDACVQVNWNPDAEAYIVDDRNGD